MPLDGWDHVELWVGNAKQAAYYYEHAFGFHRTAYAGPETGVRDRASYVLEQGEIRLVVTSGLRRDHEIGDFAFVHGDGVKDIALRVPDATEAYRQAVQRGARGHPRARLGRGRLRQGRARVDRDVRRRRPHVREPQRVRGRVPPRLRGAGREPSAGPTSGCSRSTTSSATSSSAHEHWVRVLRAGVRDDRDDPLLRRGHLDRVLGADVEGDDGRRGEDQVPDQRAGRRESARARSRSTSSSTTARASQHIALPVGEHRRDRRGAAASRRDVPHDARHLLRGDAGARRRDRRELGTTCAGCASSPTATTTATSCRSSRRRPRTGRRSSSR